MKTCAIIIQRLCCNNKISTCMCVYIFEYVVSRPANIDPKKIEDNTDTAKEMKLVCVVAN